MSSFDTKLHLSFQCLVHLHLIKVLICLGLSLPSCSLFSFCLFFIPFFFFVSFLRRRKFKKLLFCFLSVIFSVIILLVLILILQRAYLIFFLSLPYIGTFITSQTIQWPLTLFIPSYLWAIMIMYFNFAYSLNFIRHCHYYYFKQLLFIYIYNILYCFLFLPILPCFPSGVFFHPKNSLIYLLM